MAHFALLWKARTIEKYRQNYENEKINSIMMSRSDVPDKTLFQRWRYYKHGMQKRLSRTFSNWYPEGSTMSNFFVNLRTDMKLPNILLRSFYGFIGGLLLTYLGFMFFVFQLSVSLMYATVLSSIIGVLLTLGLTFSNRMRCLIFLLVPQLFSRVGRYTLTCYALVLILTGPATNTLKNSEVLSESMACSQEQIKLNVKQINDSMKKPFNSIKDSLKTTIKRMNYVVRKLKIALIRINKLILNIASTIQSGYSWLRNMAEACNDALGTPHHKCLTLLKEQCEKCDKHYVLNDLEPKNIKGNKNFIRDILHAIGIKNVKKKQEDNSGFGYFKKDKEKGKHFERYAKGINNAKDKKGNPKVEDNYKAYAEDGDKSRNEEDQKDAKTDSKRYPSSENKFLRKNDEKRVKPWFCNPDSVAKSACASLLPYEKFCVAADFTGDTFLTTIRQKLTTFICRVSTLLHAQLNIQHTYTYLANCSSSQVAAGIVTEIRNRADPLLTWLSWSSCVTSLFLLLIIFRAKHYQHMFETRSRFDNRFITKEFRELDLKRLREGRETVLPLNTRERAKYVTTTSFRLVASEKLHLNRSAVFMTVATFKLLIHIVADYSLFWVLTTIRHHGKLLSPLKPDITDTGADISGSGYVARLLEAFVDTMSLQLSFPPPEHSCLPNPYPPDIKRYCQIGFLIFLLWFFALFEPYGLRMRHLIMGHYRPQRAKDRAVWLYNHILRTRASFMKYARRKLHREYKYSSQSKLSLREYLWNHMLLRWLSFLLGIKPEQPHCLLCNVTEDSNDCDKELIKCEVPNCPGIYCGGCFLDIGQLCTICLSPADYGDFSDVSMENGSSDEDNNDKDPEDPSRSNKRNSNSDFYTLEDVDSDDGDANSIKSAFSKRRQLEYFFRRIGNRKSDTIPLLKHSVKCHPNDEKEEINTFAKCVNAETKVVTNEILPKNTKTRTNQIHNLYDFYDIHTQVPRLSAIDILLYSIYKITSNPLHIVKSEYTTSVAKYLRRRKLLRHKKSNQKYSKYFMTCSNTNINKNEDIKNISDIRDQNKDFKKTKKNAKNNLPNKEQKCSYNDIHIKIVETKNKEVLVKNTKHRRKSLHTGLSKYWKNVMKTVLNDKSARKTKENKQPKEMKHKRKKKRKKTKITLKKLKPKEEAVDSSRIFAYLDDRDWANCGVETNHTKKDKEIHTTKGEISLINNEMKHKTVVNDILIPRLDLNLSSDSITISQLKISNETKITTSAKRKDGKQRLGRFFNSIACSSCELFRSSLVVNVKDDLPSRASEPYLPIQESMDKKFEDSPGSIHSVCREANSSEDVTKLLFASLSKPLLVLKSRCSSIFLRKTKKEKRNEKPKNDVDKKSIKFDRETQTIAMVTKTDEKEVSARPQMTSRGCQNILRSTHTQDFSVQVKVINKNKTTCICKDANIMTDISIGSKSPTRNDLVLEDDSNLDTSSTRTSNTEESNGERTICSYANIDCKNTLFDLRKDLVKLKDRGERSNNHNERKYEHADREYDGGERTYVSNVRNKYQTEIRRGKMELDDQDVIPNFKATRDNDHDERFTGQNGRINNGDRRKKYHAERIKDQFELDDCKVARAKDEDDKLNSQSKRLNKRGERLKAGKGNLNYQSGPCNEQGELVNGQSGRLNGESERHNKNKKYINSPFGKLKISVVTKSNQSTLTEKMTRCDVSTATNDWWSPLVERRSFLKKTSKAAEMRRKNCAHSRIRERQTFRNKGISTGDKIVTFKSKTQLIPSVDSVFGDIMSPARYLLESQKYYNELFYNIFASPRVYPGNNIQKNQYSERDRTQISTYHYRRKGRKIKRLEDSYSPRKDVKPSQWIKRLE